MSAFLRDIFPGIDDDTYEYLKSIVDDSSLEENERIDLMADFLESSVPTTTVSNFKEIAQRITEEVRLEHSNKEAKNLTQITQKAVAACLEVLRAPEMKAPKENEVGGLDASTKKFLLKQYDDDSKFLAEPLDDEEEIMGLGRNENRMRIVREREEQRAAAKQEQLDAQAERVAQKLKSQGERIKDRTVRGKRS